MDRKKPHLIRGKRLLSDGTCDTAFDADEPDVLVLEFWTPDVPPKAGIANVAAIYPSLRFHLKYDEANCELLGIIVWSDGKLVRHRAA